MIKSITMKSCATYPTTCVTIDNCQKINFFYGPNGSGKSTIANFLDNPSDSQYRECEINWENNTCMDIIVYNKNFRNRHFKGNIDGIFTLGKATIEEMEKIDKMKEERNKKQEEYSNKTNSLLKKKNLKINLRILSGIQFLRKMKLIFNQYLMA